MEIFLFWFIFAVIVGVAASGRGRSGFGWFVLAMVISPLLALILLVLLPKLKGEGAAPNPSTHVKCPDCAELVLKEARVCKHCGCRLVPESQAEARARADAAPLTPGTRTNRQPLASEAACPHCGGLVPRKAWVCKHCNRNIDLKQHRRPA